MFNNGSGMCWIRIGKLIHFIQLLHCLKCYPNINRVQLAHFLENPELNFLKVHSLLFTSQTMALKNPDTRFFFNWWTAFIRLICFILQNSNLHSRLCVKRGYSFLLRKSISLTLMYGWFGEPSIALLWLCRSCWASCIALVIASPSPRNPDI